MRTVAGRLQERTYVTPEEELFYNLYQSVVTLGDTTSATDEKFELRKFPSVLILEQQFDIITDKETLAFEALTDIQKIAKGKLSNWKEEEHLGEKFLFEMLKGKSRV